MLRAGAARNGRRRSRGARGATTVGRLAGEVLRQYLAEASAAAAALRRTPGGMPLHDYRVSLRRFRTALRLFAPSAARTGRPPERLRRLLSTARDESVWLARAERWCASGGRDRPRDRAYLRRLRGSYRRRQAALARAVAGGALSMALARVRRSLPRVLRGVTDADATAAAFAARALRRALRRLVRRKANPVRPAEWHALRRRVRRVRYLADIFTPLLAPAGGEPGRALRRASSALGTVHDMDVAAARLAGDHPAPGWIRRRVRRERVRAVRRFGKQWKRLRRLAKRGRIFRLSHG